VDVAKVQGNRCETIVRDLANAIGAEVKQTRKKDSYFQLPGEPAKTTQRVRI
jgi:adenylate cyclase class IV